MPSNFQLNRSTGAGLVLLFLLATLGCDNSPSVTYDTIIRGGTIYDGSGTIPYQADIGFTGQRIAAIGDLGSASGGIEIDATGKAVSPGFINMIGWGVTSLIKDGRGISDISQGITLEVFGEGNSMGPLSPSMREEFPKYWDQITPSWKSLGEYLSFLKTGACPLMSPLSSEQPPRGSMYWVVMMSKRHPASLRTCRHW